MTTPRARVVSLASGLNVRVSVQRAEWLALLPPVAPGPASALTLRVQQAEGRCGLEDVPGPFAFRAALEWSSPQWASYRVPGGVGRLCFGSTPGAPIAIDAELEVEPGREQGSIETALRMLAGLSLAASGGALLHASSVVIDGRAALLLGASGAGKTTTARRLGREGALRIADDLVVVRRVYEPDVEPSHAVECFLFDRAARLPGRLARSWPLAGAYTIVKNAAVTAVGPRVEAPLSAWCSALFAPTSSPLWGNALLETVLGLASRVPLRMLAVAPSGSVRAAL